MIKIGMATPQTHVRHGALEADEAREFLIGLGIDIPMAKAFNTSREIFDCIMHDILSFREREGVRVGHTEGSLNPSPPNLPLRGRLVDPRSAMIAVCNKAKRYAESIMSGIPVVVHLVSYEGDIVAESE